MAILIFLIVLGALIFVHELGHFLVAKATKMRVDEFALGFPPRLWSKKVGETEYSINALPLGGYVRIFGENPDDDSAGAEGSFTSKNRCSQALVLVAGVVFNVLFAWMLLWGALMMGFIAPSNLTGIDESSIERNVYITGFASEEAPAYEAGLKLRDEVVGLAAGCAEGAEPLCSDVLAPVDSPDAFIDFVERNQENGIYISYLRGEEAGITSEIVAQEGIFDDKKAIGVAVEELVFVKSGFITAGKQSFYLTGYFIRETFVGLWTLIADAFRGEGSLEGVSGPVGIVGIVGGAAEIGFSYLITLAAVISINLAVINIFPIPALDGGRLVFVAIESIIRKPIPFKFQVWANTIGFIALMLLMLVLTVFDVGKLF